MSATFLLDRIGDFFFPSPCACCGAPLLDPDELRLGVCGGCAGALIPETGERCVRCGRPLVSERGTCLECREKPEPFHDGAWALFRFGGAPRRLLEELKFGGGRASAAFVARLFAERIREAAESDPAGVPTVVPVPPRPGKLKRTGWDQIEAVASRLSDREGLRVSRCLRRLSSRTQKGLNGPERVRNARGSFVCAVPPPETAVVVDDVLTTGATLDACARALKEAGCRRATVLAFCYD